MTSNWIDWRQCDVSQSHKTWVRWKWIAYHQCIMRFWKKIVALSSFKNCFRRVINFWLLKSHFASQINKLQCKLIFLVCIVSHRSQLIIKTVQPTIDDPRENKVEIKRRIGTKGSDTSTTSQPWHSTSSDLMHHRQSTNDAERWQSPINCLTPVLNTALNTGKKE